ncbi:MAG: hypothetical protein NVSMB6_06100 [Burkholderiaceae bacterium]
MTRLPMLLSFLLFISLCASTAYWALQLWHPPVRLVAAPVPIASNDPPIDAAAGLFGGRPVTVGVASNYQLKGVVVAGNGRESVAILSADGKPAQAVGLNTEFQPGVKIKEVHPRYVLLSEGGVVKRVTLPESAGSQQATFTAVPMSSPTPAPMQMAPQVPMPVAPQMPMQAVSAVPGQISQVGQIPMQGQLTGQPVPPSVPNFVPPPSSGGNGMQGQRN